MNSKKGLSVITASVLLLLVVVFAIVAFQKGLLEFSSRKVADTELTTNDAFLDIHPQALVNGQLYLNKNDASNITVLKVYIDNVNCTSKFYFSSMSKQLDITSCLKNYTPSKDTSVIKVVTNSGVFTNKLSLMDYSPVSVVVFCTLDSITRTQGQSYNFYNASSVPYGQTCSFKSRTCQASTNYNGSVSFQYASCAVGAQDIIPNVFSFTNQTGVLRSTLATSNSLTPTGYDGPLAVSIGGSGSPQISVNGGGWTTSTTMMPGQTLQARLTASASYSTTFVASITLGSYSTNWGVTSESPLGKFNRTLDGAGGINVGAYSSVAIGSDGFPVISYQDSTNADLKLYKCNNIGCTSGINRTIDSANNVGQYTSIIIGNDGFPVISYFYGTGADLKVAKCNDISCSSSIITTLDSINAVGYYTSIAKGSDGNFIIAYQDQTANNAKVYHCVNAACAGGGTATTITTAAVDGQFTSIAIGTDNLPIISFQDSTNGDLIVYHCSNVACSGGTSTIAVNGVAMGSDSAIAIGIDGYPIISLKDSSSNFMDVYHCTNPTCTSGVLRSPLDPVPNRETDIMIGSDNLPIISYADTSAGGKLKVYHCNDMACNSGVARVIDSSTGTTGWYSSIAKGSDGLPVITYEDVNNQD